MFKEKTDQELSTLTTKKLLRYYRAERKRYLIATKKFILIPLDDGTNQNIINWYKYVLKLKTMLDEREHVESK